MTTSKDSETPRRKRGFERTSRILAQRIRKASETRGFSESRVLTHWAEIVGEAVAAVARPVSVSYSKGGFGATLTLLTTGAQGPMLQMQEPKLREKINAVYGYNAISRIRFTQTAPTGFAEGQAAFAPAAVTTRPALEPATRRGAANLAEGVNDDALRRALEALGAEILNRSKKTEPETPL
ncbi:DUF721 domain-containing protein [Tropicimonas sp. IMCC6043]|uniref:DUF721 domain-containing protein n=1 Tax=Tropicimonas sp. IMCC6043 TaxID=2510645 RepID=UPI00101C0404|nr:DUF721 domain-containing protein [Tropicimonas sp. IMCC6043]RYH09097.1 DUF721 domain-containing protein [Tropicimonas sp. IMCC6043]